MKRKLALTGIGILILIFASVGWYLYNKPHAGVSRIDADVRISASDLYNSYQQDETLADVKYLNKVIEVTGNVFDIQTSDASQIVLLSSIEATGGVSCRLSTGENDRNMVAKKSKMITIKGRCSGFLMDVNLVDCIIK